jgi:hypothetical protein
MGELHVYVAGAWLEQATRAKVLIRALRSRGVRITHDWTLPDGHPELTGEKEMVKSEYGLEPRVRRGYALADLRGVREADLLLLAVPAHEGRGAGCFFEAGYAHARGIPLKVAGPNWRATIFSEVAIGCYDSDEEAVRAIAG